MANLWRQRNPELAKQKDKEYRLARLNDPVYTAKRALVQKNYALKVKARNGKRVKDCGACGKPFEPKGVEKYCSAECRDKAERRLANLFYHSTSRYENAKIKKCKICGDEFSTLQVKGPQTICLKATCKKELKRKRSKSGKKARRHKLKAIAKGCVYNLTEKHWRDALLFFDFCCAYCGAKVDKLHQEHVIPVAKGGGYTANNIVPSCPTCNSYKRDQWLEQWYDKQNFYSQQRYFRVLLFLGTRGHHV